MGIKRVQENKGNGSGGSAAAISWSSTTTSGNLAIAIVGGGGTTSTVVTPPSGWSLAVRGNSNNSFNWIAIYYIENVGARSGSESFGLSFSQDWQMYLVEYSGILTASSLDKTTSSAGNSATPDSGTTASVSAGDLCLAAFNSGNSNPTALSAPTNGYVLVDQVSSVAFTVTGFAEAVTPVAGTQDCSVTTASALWTGAIATFKANKGIQRIQEISSSSTNSPDTVSWSSPTTDGNTLIAVAMTQPPSTVTPPADWQQVSTVDNATRLTTTVFYIPNAASRSGSEIFSYSPDAPTRSWLVIAEYANLAASPLDQTATNTGNSATLDSGTTSTTSQADELWIAAQNSLTVTVLSAPTNGFTIVDQLGYPGGNQGGYLERIVTTTGAANSEVTGGASFWASSINTFKGQDATTWQGTAAIQDVVTVSASASMPRTGAAQLADVVTTSALAKMSYGGSVSMLEVATLTSSAKANYLMSGSVLNVATTKATGALLSTTPVISSFSPPGPLGLRVPGNVVTAFGSFFFNVSDVSVGGTSVAFTVLSSSQLQFTLPNLLGSASVIVTTGSGESDPVIILISPALSPNPAGIGRACTFTNLLSPSCRR